MGRPCHGSPLPWVAAAWIEQFRRIWGPRLEKDGGTHILITQYRAWPIASCAGFGARRPSRQSMQEDGASMLQESEQSPQSNLQKSQDEDRQSASMLGYALGILSVILAAGLALAVRSWMGEVFLFPFFVAIAATACFSGPLQAWIATLIATLIVD